jgi:hypothetical protein
MFLAHFAFAPPPGLLFKFVVGATAVMYMIGTEIDYVKDLMGATFQVKNPNAQSACGCGVSVNFDMDKLAEPVI